LLECSEKSFQMEKAPGAVGEAHLLARDFLRGRREADAQDPGLPVPRQVRGRRPQGQAAGFRAALEVLEESVFAHR
jgi:hypothetical protein